MYGSIMTAFPDLSDADIEAIYAYIEKESTKLEVDEGYSRYDPCYNLVINDTIGEKLTRVISTKKIGKPNKPEQNQEDIVSIPPDTALWPP